MSSIKKGFTLVEILVYLLVFTLIIALVFPILSILVRDYLTLRGKIDLKSETRNIFLRIYKEVLKSNSLDILTDWEIVFNQKNERVVIFQTEPVYLDLASSSVKGLATNLSIGRISFSGDNYRVSFVSSSTCLYASNKSVPAKFYLSGYAWSPNIGWIKFRNDHNESIVYGVCLGTDYELRGWAWNDVVGWISFNCADLNICNNSNYKVIMKNNYLYGYAWNDVLGWIIFDGHRGSVYLAKMNSDGPSSVEAISDPRIFVKELKFSKIGKTLKVNLKAQSPEGAYEENETAIVLPFE